MGKVITGFYCSKEKKTYAKGDEYIGNRTDLGDLIEQEKKTKVLTPELKKKPSNKSK